MYSFVIGLFFLVNFIGVRAFVFESESRRRTSNTSERPLSPSTIDSIFQIPIAVIQGTSAAAQSWSPENGDTIDKVFHIPVQTLQAVGNLVKDRVPQRREIRRDQRQTSENPEDYSRRHHHSPYNAWVSAVTDFLVGPHGHGGLFGGHGNLWSGNKKKKKKKINQHGHLGSHGGHFGSHQGHQQGYQVTEDTDDIAPENIFSWRPRTEKIQNKIAPGFYDRY